MHAERHISSLFDILILTGRPAAGKSEIIDFLKRTSRAERAERLHIGEFREIDDFPMIWAWFEEDHILERNGWPRLHTDSDGYFTHNYLWHVLIERLELEYWKLRRGHDAPEESDTAIIEFSRGSEHGGYQAAFSRFSPELLKRAAVMYIDVPFEESLRKNRKRFNPEKPHSILEHALPDEKLYRLYGEVDWEELIADTTTHIPVNGVQVPYAVFPNADDVTSDENPELSPRLSEVLGALWSRYSATRVT